jgi:hypothetical protein
VRPSTTAVAAGKPHVSVFFIGFDDDRVLAAVRVFGAARFLARTISTSSDGAGDCSGFGSTAIDVGANHGEVVARRRDGFFGVMPRNESGVVVERRIAFAAEAVKDG